MAFELDESLGRPYRLPLASPAYPAGRIYEVWPVAAELGIKLQALWTAGVTVAAGAVTGGTVDGAALKTELLSDLGERDLYAEVLGGDDAAYGLMVADAVPWESIKHAALTVIMGTTMDRESAETYWRHGTGPAADPRPAPQDHKAPAGRTTGRANGKPRTSRSTGSGSRTPAQGSMTATTSRPS